MSQTRIDPYAWADQLAAPGVLNLKEFPPVPPGVRPAVSSRTISLPDPAPGATEPVQRQQTTVWFGDAAPCLTLVFELGLPASGIYSRVCRLMDGIAEWQKARQEPVWTDALLDDPTQSHTPVDHFRTEYDLSGYRYGNDSDQDGTPAYTPVALAEAVGLDVAFMLAHGHGWDTILRHDDPTDDDDSVTLYTHNGISLD